MAACSKCHELLNDGERITTRTDDGIHILIRMTPDKLVVEDLAADS